MKIIIAKTAGFCMGVKRAVDLALENAGKTPGGIKTIGPLIHNRQTVDMLKERRVT
jgi:4-hydroxy-3-methylbut-2-enyl diphosphate reductase